MNMLNGTWRLVYSSAFSRGGLGGSRPGPPPALVPFKLGQVRNFLGLFLIGWGLFSRAAWAAAVRGRRLRWSPLSWGRCGNP